jgi:hypothetical protein
MKEKDIFQQYTWVLKVLDSCENSEQVETSKKLFSLYLKNWKKTDQNKLLSITNNFKKEISTKSKKLKNKKSFFSKISGLFLF